MKTLHKSFFETKQKLDEKAEWFAFHHPYFTCLSAFVGAPIFVLLAVFTSTLVISLPCSLLFGWM